jgi:AAA domain
MSPRFGKNVLTQYLRTECDKLLYLALFTESELKKAGMPELVKIRPEVQILRDEGKVFEQGRFSDLDKAFGSLVIGKKDPSGTKYVDTDLQAALGSVKDLPAFIIQGEFTDPTLKFSSLTNLGMVPPQIALVPEFTTFKPDVVMVDEPTPGEEEVLPDGTRRAVTPGDGRKCLRVTDIKHAGEANSSYSAEVALYAWVLSNWLRLRGLEGNYFVSTKISLWTGANETSILSSLLDKNPGAVLGDKINAYCGPDGDLEHIDFATFMQSLRHFFEVDLPRVLKITDWKKLEYHVYSRCSACDFLGYLPWLTGAKKKLVEDNPDHYCFKRAKDEDHISQIADMPRGARRTLEAEGVTTSAGVASTLPDDPVFDLHNALKADRKHLPQRASALAASTVTTRLAPNVSSADFPSYADLEVFISVNFDSSAGRLTGLGLGANFRQRTPFGVSSTVNRSWPAKGLVVLASDADSEYAVLIDFLASLAEIFRFAYDRDPAKGGPLGDKTRTHLYFWERRQFIELTKAIGRHLPAVLAQSDKILVSLAWLFPSEELLEDSELVVANPLSFVRDLVRRALYLSTPHVTTLFNVAESYISPPPYLPGHFLRDPFSDMIPRERIHEIWSGERIIEIGGRPVSRSTCIGNYTGAIEAQVRSLRSVAWQLRKDLTGRLHAEAKHLDLGIPHQFRGLSDDSRLWLGWSRLEEKCAEVERKNSYAADHDEVEAKYASIRLQTLVRVLPDGSLNYKVSPGSRDAKFRDTESFLALQPENISGFLNRTVGSFIKGVVVTDPTVGKFKKVQMQRVYKASLLSFDRDALEARVKLDDYTGWVTVRDYLETNGHVDIASNVVLVKGPGIDMAERVENCLRSIGYPPIAQPGKGTQSALGVIKKSRKIGTDAVTSAARVLWDAQTLSNTKSGVAESAVPALLDRVRSAGGRINRSQEKVLRHALTHLLSIVWGPPGTGKTTTAAGLLLARIWHALKGGESLRILITGPTHTAWEKLANDMLELMERSSGVSAKVYRLYSSYHPDHAQLPVLTNPGVSVTDVNASMGDTGFQAMVGDLSAPSGVVIVGAVANQCYRIAQEGYEVPLKGLFDFAVIDESSQLDVSRSLFPLCTLADQFQMVLLGDRLQMPPITATEPPYGAKYMVGSIQTYLKERFEIDEQPLLENYRSGIAFVEYAKTLGYPGDLVSHSPELKLRPVSNFTHRPAGWPPGLVWDPVWGEVLDPDKPVVAITYADGRAGQANQFEAQSVVSLVTLLQLTASKELAGELDEAGNPSPISTVPPPFDEETFWKKGVGVVTPHRAQRSMIVRMLKAQFPTTDPKLIDDAVDTVERFQGGQRQTIIISFGVGDPDLIADEEAFLLQLERTNVAISRAQAKCVVLISDELVHHLPNEKEVIETARAIKRYVEDFCRNRKAVTVPDSGGTLREAMLRWH